MNGLETGATTSASQRPRKGSTASGGAAVQRGRVVLKTTPVKKAKLKRTSVPLDKALTVAKEYIVSLHEKMQPTLREVTTLAIRNYGTAMSKTKRYMLLNKESDFVPKGANFKYKLKALPEVQKSMEYKALDAQTSQLLLQVAKELGVLQLQALNLERKALVARARVAFCNVLFETSSYFTAEVNASEKHIHSNVVEFFVANRAEIRAHLKLFSIKSLLETYKELFNLPSLPRSLVDPLFIETIFGENPPVNNPPSQRSPATTVEIIDTTDAVPPPTPPALPVETLGVVATHTVTEVTNSVSGTTVSTITDNTRAAVETTNNETTTAIGVATMAIRNTVETAITNTPTIQQENATIAGIADASAPAPTNQESNVQPTAHIPDGNTTIANDTAPNSGTPAVAPATVPPHRFRRRANPYSNGGANSGKHKIHRKTLAGLKKNRKNDFIPGNEVTVNETPVPSPTRQTPIEQTPIEFSQTTPTSTRRLIEMTIEAEKQFFSNRERRTTHINETPLTQPPADDDAIEQSSPSRSRCVLFPPAPQEVAEITQVESPEPNTMATNATHTPIVEYVIENSALREISDTTPATRTPPAVSFNLSLPANEFEVVSKISAFVNNSIFKAVLAYSACVAELAKDARIGNVGHKKTASKIDAALSLINSETAADRPIVNALIDQRVANVKKEHSNLLRQISAMKKTLEQLTGAPLVSNQRKRKKQRQDVKDAEESDDVVARPEKRRKNNPSSNPKHPQKRQQPPQHQKQPNHNRQESKNQPMGGM